LFVKRLAPTAIKFRTVHAMANNIFAAFILQQIDTRCALIV
jgi:hypothetical protein